MSILLYAVLIQSPSLYPEPTTHSPLQKSQGKMPIIRKEEEFIPEDIKEGNPLIEPLSLEPLPDTNQFMTRPRIQFDRIGSNPPLAPRWS